MTHLTMERKPDETAEWLEADGQGGFASGTATGVRTRRYHALLLTARTPPTGRVLLVNGFDAWVDGPSGTSAITSQRYAPDVVHPDGAARIEAFAWEPWPRWTFRLADGTALEQEILVHETSTVILWRLATRRRGYTLRLRPLLSGRDYHSLHHENGALRFDPEVRDGTWTWRPYPGIPPITAAANAAYVHEPAWYRNFSYVEEERRGLDHVEDLASPGTFRWDLSAAEAFLVLRAGEPPPAAVKASAMRQAERRRRAAFATPLDRAADAYLVRRGDGKTIVAGYPWFTDWGRDTFIAIRGLAIATGRLDDARDILVEWAGQVSEGMLPNRFVDAGDAPELNSVDAPLWYVIAATDYLRAADARGVRVTSADRKRLHGAIEAILDGFSRGTRYRIHVDDDGLVAAGENGVQLTWMDAKVGDWVVTPRIGKPVEIQALWLNALAAASTFSSRFDNLHRKGLDSFRRRFWNDSGGYLNDVVDCDHRPATADPTFRPNQIFAVGGLPLALLEGDRARRVVDEVERRLWTPVGPRSLAPDHPGYRRRYEGGVVERDGSYHQGTVWPWLWGPFVEAWVRVRGSTAAAKREARQRFIAPLVAHLEVAGLGHISEIADGDPPHTPCGCPWQAWSLGELMRLTYAVLSDESEPAGDSQPRDTPRSLQASPGGMT